MPQILRIKIATEPKEFEQIHRLNYETFVEEIPQHRPEKSRTLVDKFHDENTYVICKDENNVLGMLAIRNKRPFSLDEKLSNLESYLPSGRTLCEIRLLAIRKGCRHTHIFRDLIAKTVSHCRKIGCDIAVISGALGQKKLYEHLGFIAFGPIVGTPQASFQPMYLTIETYEKTIRRIIESACPDAKKTLLLPGPVRISAEVKSAFNMPAISHRCGEFFKILNETKNLLRRLTNAKYVAILMGSGTLANDVIAGQLSLKKEKALILTNGEFGERIIRQAKCFKLLYDSLSTDWTKPFDFDALEKYLETNPGVKLLWAVHCETSTGMLNDVSRLKMICRRRGISLCLDCVSSLGTVEVDLSGIKFASSVSGKGLCSFSGLSFVFYDEAPLKCDTDLPVYLDLANYHYADATPFTISSNLVSALYESLKSRFLANAEVSIWLKNELRQIGLKTLIDDQYANPAVITICLHERFDSREVGLFLENKGFSISFASDYLLKKNWIQICLIGQVSKEELMPLIEILRQIVY